MSENKRGLIVKLFSAVVPQLSDTERVALESGTIGWDRELLSGKPNWKVLNSLESGKLTDEEQAFLDGPTEELCKMLDETKLFDSKEKMLPDDVWKFIKDNGFLGMVIPKEYGGKGFSALAHSAVIMKISSRSVAAATNVMVPNSLGPGELLHHYGTEEQKKKYLPRLASGDEIPCFALTAPNAGSDAGSIPDKGVVFKDDDGEIKIRLTCDKRYITLAPIATLVGIAYQLEDPDNLLGKGKHPGITLSLVPSNTEGLKTDERLRPMDLPFPNGTVKANNVVISADSIIGGKERAGDGWRMLMDALSIGRSISLPSSSTAGGKLASYTTGAYSRVRNQFGLPIGKFEGIEEPLSRIAGLTYLMDGARVATARMVDRGEKPTIPSAIVKYHLTESMRQAINDAMDVQAGKAVIKGPRNYIANAYQSIPVGITVEGANIMTRNLIIFGQGSVRAHPYMLDMVKALEENKGAKFMGLAMKLTGSMLRNAVSAWAPDFMHSSPVRGKEAKFYKKINRLSAAFNLASNVSLITIGGGLKRKERVSARLGDVMSHLYLASTALHKFQQDGRPEEDRPLLEWACRHSLSKAEEALDDVLQNYPSSLVSFALRQTVFPTFRTALSAALGVGKTKPDDKLEHKVTQTILNAGPARDRLTAGIFKPAANENDETLGNLENAFQKIVAVEPLEAKIKDGIRAGKIEKGLDFESTLVKAVQQEILTNDEATQIRQANTARDEVVRVDAYPSSSFTSETPKASSSIINDGIKAVRDMAKQKPKGPGPQ